MTNNRTYTREQLENMSLQELQELSERRGVEPDGHPRHKKSYVRPLLQWQEEQEESAPANNGVPTWAKGLAVLGVVSLLCGGLLFAVWLNGQIDAANAAADADAPTASAGQTEPADTDDREFEMTQAGADFFARGVEELDGDWMRIREAGNREYCAWSNQFQMQVSQGVSAQIPHCLEWRLTGTGQVQLTFRPDSEGYSTSDTQGTGLAWWPSGNAGEYRVRCGSEEFSEWQPLTTGPEGVNFPEDGEEVTIEFRLENGYVSMPLGEIRNNVQPQFCR